MTTHTPAHGFTLIEIMIVMALIAIVSGFAAIQSLASFESTLGNASVEVAESVLRSARASAQAGVCQNEPCAQSHRVWLESGLITLDGTAADGIESYSLEGVTVSQPTEWLFIGGSGDLSSGVQTLLTSSMGGWQAYIGVTSVGQITTERSLP